ncbi:redoxin domain-containing protein [Rhodanobacter sp. FDAARGOS 1247]|uniref:redoxin domain-containing protein n=1 Tax=unclassified Rhodanobacter TaxID=2621553 RepID=UPI0006FF4838|nr:MULTISPECIES: redoxin domain-containing protein [unclassified Rhodanobacter]KQZ69207.1 alkyl hydroperoxide reductase [Rhodanobacter sp. Root561]QRP63079.1 redoxin domain-containing protein [Rhodanobacter sp. FDAARGOS 1247]
MRLFAPAAAPALDLVDIHGRPIAIHRAGRLTLLSFFRDAACPFCNFRIYELTSEHAALAARGLDIVAVFSASQADVLRFAGHRPRPFPLAADPTSRAHEIYGIERSLWRKLKAIVTRVPTLLRGMRLVGLAGLNTSNLMPADFVIDEHGRIVEAYYGRDAGDRIPLERVQQLLPAGRLRKVA